MSTTNEAYRQRGARVAEAAVADLRRILHHAGDGVIDPFSDAGSYCLVSEVEQPAREALRRVIEAWARDWVGVADAAGKLIVPGEDD